MKVRRARWIVAAAIALGVATAGSARADPIRILVAASHSRGAPGEMPLLHAAADVDHVRDVLEALGGFRPADVVTLTDPTVAALASAIDRARVVAAAHARDDVTFLFYFSGHGDRDRLHLGAEALSMADLTARVAAVPAALRVLVTDACRNYPTRTKGITTEPGFAVATPETRPADGVIWLFSSADGEPSLESDELQGALFTYYWVSALRGAGDANGDGRVTLGESYDFAYSQTLLRSSRASGVLQHPAAVFDVREAAPIVLTRTVGADALVRFPPAADTHFLVYAVGSRAVLGELWGSADRATAFALPAGRYLVERSGASGTAGLELSLSAGEARTIGADEFRAVPAELLATKGGSAVLRPNELGVEFSLGASRVATFGQQAAARYAYRWDDWALAVGLTGGLGTLGTSAENVHIATLGGDAEIERRWEIGRIGFGFGVGGEADVIWQTLERTDAARVAAAGYPTTQRYTALAPGPVGLARFRLSTSLRTWVELVARGGVLFPEMGDAPAASWTARAGVAAGVGF